MGIRRGRNAGVTGLFDLSGFGAKLGAMVELSTAAKAAAALAAGSD
jgi:hypothetical protein